jgi:hypothetical protein
MKGSSKPVSSIYSSELLSLRYILGSFSFCYSVSLLSSNQWWLRTNAIKKFFGIIPAILPALLSTGKLENGCYKMSRA